MSALRGHTLQALVAGGVSLAIIVAAYLLEQPVIMAAAGVAPVAGIIAWSNPFIVCALFIAISYFRLPEAYPFLTALRPALLLGIGSLALVAFKAILSTDREVGESGLLRAACLVTLALAITTAGPYSLVAGGTSGADVIAIPVIMILAMLCIVAWYKLLSATGPAPFPVSISIFIVYFCIVSVSVIFAVIPVNSYNHWSTTTWKIAVMTLAIAWAARTGREFAIASHVFTISGGLLAAVAVYNQWYGLSLVEGTRVTIGREMLVDAGVPFEGVLGDPNDLALILLFPLGFAAARLVHRSGPLSTLLAGFLSALILAGIIATQSRGAIIGVLAVVGTLIVARLKSIGSAALAIAVALPLLVGAMGIGDRKSGGYAELSESGIDESSQTRIEAWLTALNMAAARPLTGVGLANFGASYFNYTDYWRKLDRAAHSMWFEVLADCGVLALATFVAMIVVSFRVNARCRAELAAARAPPALQAVALGLHAALAGTCASGTFLSQAHTWPVYLIIALIAALANYAGLQTVAHVRVGSVDAAGPVRMGAIDGPGGTSRAQRA